MKPVVHGRQPGSKNYTKEFREAVAAEANDPNRSIAEVARAHGLNANMVAQWRRSLLDTQPAPSVPNIALLPVDVVDLPAKDVSNHVLPQTPDVSASPAMPPGCEIEIEVGKRRIRTVGAGVTLCCQIPSDGRKCCISHYLCAPESFIFIKNTRNTCA
ncbi:transposase [Burkholderia seminalis]|uniref:transposase n=1 Tax=Burkholderia seminalis TaxID=488731 RepID=UPI001CF22554|nr:transposase [Burkholderia seminalis]MCA7955783.1 transposase [Burkholderia seminalis]